MPITVNINNNYCEHILIYSKTNIVTELNWFTLCIGEIKS